MLRKISCLLLTGSTLLFAQPSDISLSGTVKDKSGSPVSGAKIYLASDTAQKAETANDGKFSIVATNIARAYNIQVQKSVEVTGHGASLNFSVTAPVSKGEISIFSGNGRIVKTVNLQNLAAGSHNIPLIGISNGFYILQITMGDQVVRRRLISAGSEIYVTDYENRSGELRSANRLANLTAVIDTLIAQKSGYKTAKTVIESYKQENIAIVLEAESVEPVVCTPPNLPAASALNKANPKLPDPFTFYDGTKLTKKSQWECRRKEILEMAQKYIYGWTPPVAPEDVTGTVSGSGISANVAYNGTSKSVNFSISGSGNILNISYGSGIAPSGARTWNIDNNAMDSYNNTIQSIYGKKAGCRIMAAVWAVNVACAVIDKNPTGGIDPDKIMTTGCSAAGKSTFVTGAFCEGVDLTVIVESGGIGAASYRMAEWFKNGAGKSMWKCADARPQNLDNTDNGNFSGAPYFSTSTASWVASGSNINKIVYLPYDQHCLLACIAPRAVCHLTNANGTNQWCHLGGTCEALSAWAAEPVWNALGVPENFGFVLPPVYDHCFAIPPVSKNLANEFFKRVFQGDKNANTDVMTISGGVQQPVSEWKNTWVDWDMETVLE